jgi:hypothetical protein
MDACMQAAAEHTLAVTSPDGTLMLTRNIIGWLLLIKDCRLLKAKASPPQKKRKENFSLRMIVISAH